MKLRAKSRPTTEPRPPAFLLILLRFRASLAGFLRSRDAGAMLFAGVMAVTLLAIVGQLMVNYSWRELQREEVRSALRASVSSAGPLLGSTDDDSIAAAEKRVGAFLSALIPGLSTPNITVSHDEDSNVTTVTLLGEYMFETLWSAGSHAETISEIVEFSFEVDRYEVAIALDVTPSMLQTLTAQPPDPPITKINALKSAVRSVLDIVEAEAADDPGSIMVALVPFGVGVNAADTCNPDPDTGACRAARSEGKERYVRMLAGPADSTAALLTAARARSGHWVDTFHHYGAGSNLGPLQELKLPADLLNNQDWNLRRTDVQVDVSAQAPNLDTGAGDGIWVVDDEDFWNGCLMARWGAYWDTAARPTGWTATDTDNWPATKAVAAWTPQSTALASTTPLHLSDAPPDASDPNTLFTAYSWPDARVGKTADHRLQSIMYELLGDLDGPNAYIDSESQGDNDWSIDTYQARNADRGGAGMCPPNPLTPLTGDTAVLRSAIDELEVMRGHSQPGFFGTYLPPGAVWALRAVSPLWRDVWNIDEGSGVRPAIPCAPGEEPVGCREDVHKAIVLVSDGENWFGSIPHRQLQPRASRNPRISMRASAAACASSRAPNYVAASEATNATDFNAEFDDYTTTEGKFDPASAKMQPVLDAFHAYGDSLVDTTTRRSLRQAVLEEATPWEIFRGVDSSGSIDKLLDDSNEFGFEGRPVQVHHLCGLSSLFGPYGRVNDAIRVGYSTDLVPKLLEPVLGEAPLAVDFDVTALEGQQEEEIRGKLTRRLDDWLLAACELAGERRVRVNIIYIGNAAEGSRHRTLLGDCVTLAGGDPDRDVYITPTARELQDTFVDIFTIRRNLRFRG